MRLGKKYGIRLDTFDFIKGLLVITIILGHKVPHYGIHAIEPFGVGAFVMNIIRNGGIPAFFVIAGFGIRATSSKNCLQKSFRDLLIPYIYVLMAYVIFFPLFHYAAFRWWPGAIHELIRFVLAFLLGIPKTGKVIWGYELYECSGMWFFLSLFIAHNVINWIIQSKDEKKQYILVLICVVLGFFLATIGFDYYCIPQGLLGVGYCYIGVLIKKKKIYSCRNLPFICVVLTVIAGIEAIWGGFYMAGSVFKLGIIEIFFAGCSGLLLALCGIAIANMECNLLGPIKSIGIYSYWIMCIHAVEMSCVPWYLWRGFMKDSRLLGLFLEICTASVIMIVGCVLIKKIIKYRYKRSRMKNEHV